MRLQRMLGHMTTLIPPQASASSSIGCGAGVTAGAVSVDPAVTNETIAEIEPLGAAAWSPTYFGEHNFNVVKNPKVHVRIDDARHYVHDVEGEVRRDHVRSARPVGEGRGDALHARVLRVRRRRISTPAAS